MKTRFLDRSTPGRNLIFATGTPIANSMAEMYTVQRYLDPRGLGDAGASQFDAWAALFGDSVTGAEISPDGAGARLKTRFARFRNIPELIQMYRKFADVVTVDDLKKHTNIILPELEGGQAATEMVDGSDDLRAYVTDLAARAEAVRGRRVDPKVDNMLKISSDGRKAALDMRLVDPLAKPDPNRKAVAVAKKAYDIYKASSSRKLAQLIFLDLSTPTKDGSFNVYDDIRALLVKHGVPRDEIAYIHDADSDQKKGELFAAVREGRKRILLGSTEKMGVGTNVQRLLKALHHVDAPWRPADLEQRNGRIVRQGNLNDTVGVFQYITEGSFDAYMWQGLERKARFINAIKKGDPTVRNMEDIDEQALSYAEVKALASGNPLILEKAKVDGEVERLTRLSFAHRDKQIGLRQEVSRLEGYSKSVANKIAALDSDLKKVEPTRGDAFKMTVSGTEYPERTEAGKALWEIVKAQHNAAQEAKRGTPGAEGEFSVGKIGGFDVTLSVSHGSWPVLVVRGARDYEVEIDPTSGPKGALSRLENQINNFADQMAKAKEALAEAQDKIAALTPEIGKTFDRADALTAALARQKEIDDKLLAAGEKKPETAAPKIGEYSDEENAEYRGWREELAANQAPRTKELLNAGAGLRSILGHIAAENPNSDMQVVANALLKVLEPKGTTLKAMPARLRYSEASGNYRDGFYRPLSDEIFVSPDLEFANTDQIILHEAIHAATVHAILEETPAGKEIIDLYSAYMDMAGVGKTWGDGGHQYGFLNPREFVAEALTNPEFRKILNGIKEGGNPQGFWDRLLNAIRRILGLAEKDPLKYILENEAKLFDTTDLLARAAREGRPYRNWVRSEGKGKEIEREVEARSQPQPKAPINYAGFDDPESERRFNAGKKNLNTPDGFLTAAKERWDRLVAGFSRHWQDLPNIPRYADLQQRLRALESAPEVARDRMLRYLKNMTEGLTPQEYDIFSRKVILDDLMWEVQQDHDLPFNLTATSVPAELAKIDAILAQRPDLMDRVRARKVFVAEVAKQMVESGVLNKDQALNPSYYRHVVIEYAQAAMQSAKGGIRERLRSPYWARRMGSSKDIVSNLLHAEADWLYKALTNIAEARAINWIKQSDLNVRGRVLDAARSYNRAETQKRIADDMATNGYVTSSGRATSPLNEEWMEFNKSIAMGLQGVKEALENYIDYNDIPADLHDAADAILNDQKDENTFAVLNWILENNKPGAMSAMQAFKGISGRKAWVRDLLGKDYADTSDIKGLISAGFAPTDAEYVAWQPDEGKIMFLAKTLPEHFMDKQLRSIANMTSAEIAQLLGQKGGDIKAVVADQINEIKQAAKDILAMGANKYEMVLPKEVAETLNHLKDGDTENIYANLLETPVRAWKVWTLFNPRRFIKYGLNNLSGDIDASVAGDPKVMKKLPQAMSELFKVQYRDAQPSQDYADAMERGVFSTNITHQELGDIASMSEFDHLIDKASGADVGAVRKFLLTPVGRAWNAAKGAQQFRENWLRYSAYLYAIENLRAGKTIRDLGYGASNPEMIDAVTDQRDAAALWARDLLGDYGAISTYGRQLRRFLMPFWSWSEINTKRYYRLGGNAWKQGVGAGLAKSGAIGAVLGARTTGYLMLRMFMLYGMMILWNHLMFGDDEDKLSATDQAQLHLIIGHDSSGQVMTLRLQGALSDALSWFGFQDAIESLVQMENGRADITDLLAAVATAPAKKLVGGLTPAITTPVELMTGKSLYPDPFHPRNIRDRWREGFQTFSFENEYDLLMGKPSRGYGNSLVNAVVYRRDPGEISYNTIRDLTYRWLETEKGQAGGGGFITDRSTALYEWRTALRFGDEAAAEKALARLKELHVTHDQRHQSLVRANPLGALALKDRPKFLKTLSAREKAQLEEARQWYRETFLGHNGRTPTPSP